MSDQNNNSKVSITNPLQTNNTVLMALAYGAGVLASHFPVFDSATWQTILLAVGGAAFTIYTAIINRKSSVITATANMAEVKNVDLDKTIVGSRALSDATPDNVVVK